jgi:hypothetical protein
MSTLSSFIRACFFGCAHSDMYRERRTLHGVEVLHLVCPDCGHAVPAIQRTPEEHQRVAAEGAIRRAEARRMPIGPLVAMDRRRSPRLPNAQRASA